jgi:hypothetical protein
MGSGNAADVQIQVRVDGPGQAVDVDLSLWHVAIYKK